MTDTDALRATVRETNDKYEDMLHLALPRHHEKLRKEWADAITEAIKPVIEAAEPCQNCAKVAAQIHPFHSTNPFDSLSEQAP